jgi:DNA-binding SARP family transcriptional activator
MPGIYDSWAEERRGYYSEQFARVLSALAKQAVAEKRWAAALKFAHEILRDDPYREDIHRLIMKTLAAQGKPAAVRDQFDNLSDLLKKDLGITPAPETKKVFQELMK